MKIGIYGGTFNPPHMGHFCGAKGGIDGLELDQLLLVPTNLPPHKAVDPNTPDPAHRSAMVDIMADCLGPVAQVSSIELEREGVSYTVDTLRLLRESYPEDELWFLMGSDMFLTIEQWKNPQELMKLTNLAVFSRRDGAEWESMTTHRRMIEEKYGATVALLQLPEGMEVSSTQLRDQLAKGQGGDKLLPSVYGYLMLQGLYGTAVDLTALTTDQLRACCYAMIKAKRIPHMWGTETEAIKLAHRWGVDPVLAQKAAILHDCTKYWSHQEHLELCDSYGMELDPLEREGVKLLHAKSGAIVAKETFGMSEEVVNAICWHTTAKGNMTLLEQIIYVADYMEPCRNFDGVEALRQLAYQDLKGAVLMGCELSIAEMTQRNRPLHPRTQEAKQWLVHEKGL